MSQKLAKIDANIFEKMAIDDLDECAAFLHIAAISWLYGKAKDDCRLPAELARAGVIPAIEPKEAEAAATRLVEAGYWSRCENGGYELIDHAAVIRTEIGNWRKKADRDRDSQARLRTGINQQVFSRDGKRCRACGSTQNVTVDHIFPRARGGCSELLNLQPLCRGCNSRKGALVQPGVGCCGARDERCDGEVSC